MSLDMLIAPKLPVHCVWRVKEKGQISNNLAHCLMTKKPFPAFFSRAHFYNSAMHVDFLQRNDHVLCV